MIDTRVKECDYFIWVISSRDYKSYREVLEENEFCYGKQQRSFDKEKNKNYDEVITGFSNLLKQKRKHKIYPIKLEFKKPFNTVLSFYLFDFTN